MRNRADIYTNFDPQEAQDSMIEEGVLFFDGYGVYHRSREHVVAWVEKQIEMINSRRRMQGKTSIEGTVSIYGQMGICVDVTEIPLGVGS